MLVCSSKVDAPSRGKRPVRLILGLLCWVVLIGVLLALGVWQLQRAEQKRRWLAESTQQRLEDSELAGIGTALNSQRWVPVRLTVEWLPGPPLLLDNRTAQGQVGYEVLLPARMVDGRVVTVNLGWVPAPVLRSDKPLLPAVVGMTSVTGVVGVAPQSYLLGKTPSESWRVQRIDLEALQRRWQVGLAPWVLWLEQPVAAGIRARAPLQQQLPPERHLGYAVQWFGLALVLLIAGAVFYRRSLSDEA